MNCNKHRSYSLVLLYLCCNKHYLYGSKKCLLLLSFLHMCIYYVHRIYEVCFKIAQSIQAQLPAYKPNPHLIN